MDEIDKIFHKYGDMNWWRLFPPLNAGVQVFQYRFETSFSLHLRIKRNSILRCSLTKPLPNVPRHLKKLC